MAIKEFEIGETPVATCVVTDLAGDPYDPTTSMTIKVLETAPTSQEIVAATAMTKDDTGQYHYNFDSDGNEEGRYKFVFIANNGGVKTQRTKSFRLYEP